MTGIMTSALLAGCGGNAESGAAAPQTSETSTSQATSDAGNGEITKLVVWGVGSADTEDCNEVAEAVSKITREKIGVEIELIRGKDAEQINLALTTGEPIDLLNYNSVNGQLTTIVLNNFAMPLDDLVQEYGKGALEVIDPVDLESCKYSNVLYALPNMKDTSHAAGFAMRKDIVDELGIEVPEYGTMDDMHDILVKVHEAHPELYPLVPTWNAGGMQEPLPVDALGDNLGVIEDVFGDSTTVVNLYETDSYKKLCETMYQWNQEGLVMPDATTTTEDNLLTANGFAMFENWKPGKELEVQKSNGREIAFMKMVKPYKMTTVSNGNSFIIPYSCTHPEKAMELWNLMYTDPEVSNLLINGIEGKHWVYTDDSKTMIKLPDGVDSTSSGYSSVDWSWPNQQITPIWEGGNSDLWKELNEFNTSGTPSPAFGFNWDSTSVINQITACTNVVSTYNTALRWGTMDPATAIPQFNEELKAAGIDEIIAAKQEQLNDYLASKQ